MHESHDINIYNRIISCYLLWLTHTIIFFIIVQINDVNNLTTAFSYAIFEASYGVIGKEVVTGGSGTRSLTRNNIKWQCDEGVRLLWV